MSDSRSVILKPVSRDPSVLPSFHDIFYIFFGPSVSNRRTENSICVHTDSWQPDLLQFSELVSKFNPSDRYLISYLEAGTTPLPRSVSGLGLKSIALIGDTHHLHRPISTLIDYLEGEAYDHIFFFGQPAHHCLFAWSGIKNLSGNWPKNIIYPSIQSNHSKRQSVSFFGSVSSPCHPRRGKIFCALKAALAEKDIPFDIYPHMVEQEWVDRMSQGLITVVSSLNAQPTPQIFNAIASGTFCLTDRLSVGSNLYDYFKPGLHFDVYDSIDHLLELIDFYFSRPSLTQKLSELGQMQALRYFFSQPLDEISVLQNKIKSNRKEHSNLTISRHFDNGRDQVKFRELIPLYEFFQEVHRICESTRLIFYAHDLSFVKLATACLTSLPRTQISFYSHIMKTIDLYSLTLSSLNLLPSKSGNILPPIHVASVNEIVQFEPDQVQCPTFLIHQAKTHAEDDLVSFLIRKNVILVQKKEGEKDLSLIENLGIAEQKLSPGSHAYFSEISIHDILKHIHDYDSRLWQRYKVQEDFCKQVNFLSREIESSWTIGLAQEF